MCFRFLMISLLLFVGFDCFKASIQVHGYSTSSCEGRGTPRKQSDVPCNIDKQSYCTEPGDAYPRHAVRRFVDDNQGLMRRMYGDLRHLSVLRSEMEWSNFNDVQQDEQRSNGHDGSQQLPSSNASTTDSLHAKTSSSSSLDDGNSTEFASNTNKISSTGNQNVANEPDKGINACPTNKEVVAPYWAVNTRGRTLAVVNDPPYEQHIHWEKCLHENQQMLCRDGCKCEQQFRLQRLLAFDPTCDCKGVFMDWFLLPSCCVCKCYGLSYVSNNVTTSRRRQGRAKTVSENSHIDDDDDESDDDEEKQGDLEWNLENDTRSDQNESDIKSNN